MDTIALFGGSFDPPHIAHAAIIKALISFKDVDKVVVMPTYLNPFKSKSHAPSELRLRWLKEIFSSFKDVEISSFEIEHNRPVPTIESVNHLLKRYKKIYLVIGADNLSSLHMWSRYSELKSLVTFVVASRDKIDIPNDFLKIDIDIDISSTQLREDTQISKLSQQCAKEIEEFYKEKNER